MGYWGDNTMVGAQIVRDGRRILSALAFIVSIPAFAVPAEFGLSPDNSRDLLLSTIGSAKSSILLNVYEFKSEGIADAVVNKIKSGVSVQVLVEGNPVGKLAPDTHDNLEKIQKAMASSKARGKNKLFIMMQTSKKQPRRYRYDHAKYVVVDGKRVLVTSENFSDSGQAEAGKVGNRGWITVLEDSSLAQELRDIFETDTDTSSNDILDIGAADAVPNTFRLATLPEQPITLVANMGVTKAAGSKRTVPTIASAQGDVQNTHLVTSPDSLKPLVSMIDSARSRVDLEFMSLPSKWREPGASAPDYSPLIRSLVSASKRGAKVRVLLNDDKVFGGGGASANDSGDDNLFLTLQKVGNIVNLAPFATKNTNQDTVDYLNELAECDNLSLEARIVDIQQLEITYIHNKGILVDDDQVLVSSINGTRNSIMNNREVGVQLTSKPASKYYSGAFNFDWAQSPAMKVTKAACSTLTRP
jgi:phosphatidylserine/phosphatidylglycerophosphate/cardiolipin synthase-like enzyme